MSDSNSASSELKYLFHGYSGIPSTDPLDSDTIRNSVFMHSLVGTLVKYGLSGRVEPYLASSWQILSSGTEWHFSLHQNLHCDDGTLISAQKYVDVLLKTLKQLSAKNKTPHFSELLGWDEFSEGSTGTLEGLSAEKHAIKFRFKKPPTQNFLDFLSHPYFGFYCPKNWNADGTWKSDQTIISSGSFRLLSFSSQKIVLEKRSDWPLNTKSTVQKVTILPLPAIKKGEALRS